MRLRGGVLFLVLAVLAGACGGSDAPADSGAAQSDGAAVSESPSGVTVTGSMDSKPEITIPEADPPTELEVTDLVEGDGEEVPEGATVTAHYVGKSWSTAKQFDASWDRGQPIPFSLAEVIPGWTQGIPGMKVGGRRLLVIPPDLGYGPTGQGPDIGPNETLVFVVDIVDVE